MLVHNAFSYHLTPAGIIIESGARAIGCPVIPGEVGDTELQVQAIADLRAFRVLRHSLVPEDPAPKKVGESGTDISSLKIAVVGGEALPSSLCQDINDLGVFVLQNYGTADVGLIAYESRAMEGMIIDEGVVLEIVRTGTGQPSARRRSRRGGRHHIQSRLSADPLCHR